MSRLRWKILVAMIAVVVVTVGVSALLTRQVTHQELRRVMVTPLQRPDVSPLQAHFRRNASWRDVDAVLDAMKARVILTTLDRRIIATSREFRDATVTVDANDTVTVQRAAMRLVVNLPPVRIGDAYAYALPAERQPPRVQLSALDRRLLLTFAAATIVAILLTLLLSRRITQPVERLTAAVDTMALGGRPAHVPVSGDDEIARLARSFNAMSDTIVAQEELRRRMVGDVAHELRTPLTNLRCELEAIQDGLATADPARIASLHEEVTHLGRLVDDLQELAIADAGQLQLRRERVDLAVVTASVVERMRSESNRLGRSIVLNATSAVVHADPDRIAQIVRNLLTNAIRHAAGVSPIEVTVGLHGAFGVVTVRDDGAGIPPGELDRIFERLYRVDQARSRVGGGAGLGLAIVRRLVELHGGEVRAENAKPGARFTFTIPLA